MHQVTNILGQCRITVDGSRGGGDGCKLGAGGRCGRNSTTKTPQGRSHNVGIRHHVVRTHVGLGFYCILVCYLE